MKQASKKPVTFNWSMRQRENSQKQSRRNPGAKVQPADQRSQLVLEVSWTSSSSTSAEAPEAWTGATALGQTGGDSPAKGVQWCQLWADNSKEVGHKSKEVGHNRD